MPKLTTAINSAALNADIMAVFDELELDPIREMAEMVSKGAPVTGEDGITKFVPLEPMDRFKVLKELAEYTAPKLKAVDTSTRKQQKTIIKIMQHGQQAVLANGENVQIIENRDYTKPFTKSGEPIEALVEDATKVHVAVRSAAQLETYGIGITKEVNGD